MTQIEFQDYLGTSCSANARIRMMNDAYGDIIRLNNLLKQKRIAKKEYTHAASALYISYISQLEMLPNEFWDSLNLQEHANLDTLRIYRNNLAHNYNIRKPDFNMIYVTVTTDLPQAHSIVLDFFNEYDLSHNKQAYITKPDFRHHRKSKEELLESGIVYPEKSKERVILENRKTEYLSFKPKF